MTNLRVYWRLCWRLVASAVVTVMVVLSLFLIRLLSFGSIRARRPLQRAIILIWSRSICWILGVKVEIEGIPPSPPCILVSNHLSYIDIPVLGKFVPARFVARADVRQWPVVGWMCRSIETIFVDRASRRDAHRAIQTIRHGLEVGDAIALFPEGTSSSGHRLGPFRAPLLAPAAELRLPVHHATIHYSTHGDDPPAHLAVCWWGGMDFLPHIRQLLVLSSIQATVRFGDRPIQDSDRKELAAKLRAAINDNFVPVVDFEPDDPSLE